MNERVVSVCNSYAQPTVIDRSSRFSVKLDMSGISPPEVIDTRMQMCVMLQMSVADPHDHSNLV
jgi:hypothetical protein